MAVLLELLLSGLHGSTISTTTSTTTRTISTTSSTSSSTTSTTTTTSITTRTTGTSSFAVRQMALLGSLILVFLGIHMGDFWWKMKSGKVDMVTYESFDIPVQNLYQKVEASFSNEIIVIFYVIAMIGLSFHLLHGFQSAFQTVGLNHKKYTPFVQALGKGFSLFVPALFALIPLYYFFVK